MIKVVMEKMLKHILSSDEAQSINDEVVSQMQKCGGVWQCLACGWETKFRSRLWEHVEAKHVQTNGYFCPICEKFCPSINALKLHKSRNHKNEAHLF